MRLLPYSEKNLAFALSNRYTTAESISEKRHFSYFKRYLETGLKAKTIVIEEEYINTDFLRDYAAYYAFCHVHYPKVCKRVHFFSTPLKESEFKKAVSGSASSFHDLAESYLGFIVVRPIPTTVIGFTVLKTYPQTEEGEARYFWGVREYTVNLYGNPIKLHSLAFQEQDHVVAACATTAIWSMLNKAGSLFHMPSKSSNEITKEADTISNDGGRMFPNKGLNSLQISKAIHVSGLVTEIKPADHQLQLEGGTTTRVVSNAYAKKILNAYSELGIPIIVILQIPSAPSNGLHAITVSGFSRNRKIALECFPNVNYRSDAIDKFYAHDDQWGPFAKIEFEAVAGVRTPWTESDPNGRLSLINKIIVSLTPKVRISYEDIESITYVLDGSLRLFFKNNIKEEISWDIKLRYSESFKQEIIRSDLGRPKKEEVIYANFPKYLWISSCFIGDIKILDFLFDATDVISGLEGRSIISYLPHAQEAELNKFLFKNQEIIRAGVDHASALYLKHILGKIRPTGER